MKENKRTHIGLPLVAIVGRPNVGKSRLFNRLTRSRNAIVEDTPGVTRDRNYGEVEWYDKNFNLVDTGGFEPTAEDALLTQMREQAQLAIDEADVIILVFDAQSGLLAADVEIVDMFRRRDKRVFYVVNKIDGPKHEARSLEFSELGVSTYSISAEHGLGVDDLIDDLTADFPTVDELEAVEPGAITRIAVFGRPNVGKSTLINRILGEERLLTSDIPGTTRDAIDTILEHNGDQFLLIDTAGVRRRRRISLLLEKFSVVRAFASIDRAEVVLVLIDAVEGPTDQDLRLLQLVEEKGRGVVLLINKWDAVEKTHRTVDEYTDSLRKRFRNLTHVPILFISAKTGQRVHKVLDAALAVKRQWTKRVPTARLNQFLELAVATHQPPVHRNRRLKLFYMTQARVAPPGFVIVCNFPTAVPTHYRRFLENRLREMFEFSGTPLRLYFRERKRRE